MLLPEAATAVAAGYSHTLLLGESGSVWAAGSNAHGQLGLGRDGGAMQPYPRLVRALRGKKTQVLKPCQGYDPRAAVTRASSCSSAVAAAPRWPAALVSVCKWHG